MVIRVEKTKNYTVMSNYHLRDKNLSLKAKGLLSFILSLPDEWDYTEKGLASCLKEGRDGVSATLKELSTRGYLVRRQVRNANGTMGGAEYVVYENPITEEPITEEPITEEPITEEPITEKPTSVEPISENPAQINTDVTSKEETSTEGTNTEGRSTEGRTAEGGATAATVVPYKKVVEAYHEICTSLPRVKVISEPRKKAIKARWNEWGKKLDSFKECFQKVEASDFLTGRAKDWTAGFDWIMSPSNFTKIMEGNYDNKEHKQSSPSQPSNGIVDTDIDWSKYDG